MSRPLDFFQYRKGVLGTGGLSLEKIAETTGTPVYVYSAEAFLHPLRELREGLGGLDHLICFAAKSSSNIAILKMLTEAGAGMDLVSGGELFRAGIAGAPAERIVFSGVGKTPGEMAQALEYGGTGIFSFNVESVGELEVLNAVALELGKTASVALRFNPDVDAKTHPYISTGLKKNKFGLDRAEVLEVARRARTMKAVRVRGVSIHIGSQLLSLAPVNDAFARLARMVEELERTLGEPLSFADVGGGLGVCYRNEKPPSTARYCELIHKHFGARSRFGGRLKILLEPGRFLSGNSGVLVSEVLYRKERKSKDFLVIDAAMNDLLRPALYSAHHEIVPVRESAGRGPSRKTDVVGPVCESSDCFASDRRLSAGLKQGDLVAILSAGAYGFSMASNYNSRPRPPEVLVRNGRLHVIRERETYDDLVRGEQF